MLDRYKTIDHKSEIEIIEKKSRFIASVVEVTTEEQAQQTLYALRKKYYNATHNCFAYQIGEQDEIQRFSDDGEPQGTAGKPILDVLKGQSIKNTLICVTRYYGGTLLGTGGLVRAYGKAAKEGLRAAGIVEKRRVKLFYLEVPYTLSGKLQYFLNEKGYTVRNVTYLQDVTFEAEVLMGQEITFYKWLTDHMHAEVSVQEGDYTLVSVPL